MDLMIDNEFQVLIPPLSSNEYQTLEENILKDGCRDPLVLWNGRQVYRKINSVSENKHENVEITVNDADGIRKQILAKFDFGRDN